METATWASFEKLSSSLSASVPLDLDLALAGHGSIVLAESETVRMAAAKVAAKAVDVASLFVRVDGFVMARRVALDHMLAVICSTKCAMMAVGRSRTVRFEIGKRRGISRTTLFSDARDGTVRTAACGVAECSLR